MHKSTSIYKNIQTFTCRSSAVVSSNSSPSLKEISVFLKVLSVLTTTLSPSWLMTTVGLVTLPTCLVAKPTPVDKKRIRQTLQTNLKYYNNSNCTAKYLACMHYETKLHYCTLHLQRAIKIIDLTYPGLSCIHQNSGCQPVSKLHKMHQPY